VNATPIITLTALATQLLFIVFPGLVLHHALAVRLLALDQAKSPEAEISNRDLVVYGLLPGLVIVNTLGTLLALFGLFRTEVFATVVAAAVIWRWRDATATLLALAHQGRAMWRSLARGELMVLLAILIFTRTTIGLLVDAQLPSANIDVWHHNLPLAQSIVSHAGFTLPQIPNMFYGTYPIFFHMFFAEGLLFVDHVIAAKVINTIIYLSFLLSLLFCARRGRAFAVIPLFVLIINDPLFSNGASDAMTDVPRVCFSILALVFTYRYLRDGRTYFLFAAGLLAGGAVAGKYTELLTPVLIGASFLSRAVGRMRDSWIAGVIFIAAFLPIACYPYLRNWILLGNPIYPFLFAHPGLSDQYMADLNAEVFQSFDPAFRDYVKDFLSLQGWRDFFSATHQVFLVRSKYSYLILGMIAGGLFVPRARIIHPALWTLVLAMFWYTVGNVNMRWGLSAYMMMLATAFLIWIWLVDRAVATLEPSGKDWRVFMQHARPLLTPSNKMLRATVTKFWPLLRRIQPTPNNAIRAALAGLALYFCFAPLKLVSQIGWTGLLPGWTNKELREAVDKPGGLEVYLARTRPGYEIYRFIGDHNLKTVLQPFDNGAWAYQAAYNGGRNGNWILPWYRLPAERADFDNFLRTNDIKYFIYRASLDPIEIERLGPEHVQMAYALFGQILPRSRRILVDPFGWELYALDGAPVPADRHLAR
jgi:hypothetical protein